jgi:hypothetical protein
MGGNDYIGENPDPDPDPNQIQDDPSEDPSEPEDEFEVEFIEEEKDEELIVVQPKLSMEMKILEGYFNPTATAYLCCAARAEATAAPMDPDVTEVAFMNTDYD